MNREFWKHSTVCSKRWFKSQPRRSNDNPNFSYGDLKEAARIFYYQHKGYIQSQLVTWLDELVAKLTEMQRKNSEQLRRDMEQQQRNFQEYIDRQIAVQLGLQSQTLQSQVYEAPSPIAGQQSPRLPTVPPGPSTQRLASPTPTVPPGPSTKRLASPTPTGPQVVTEGRRVVDVRDILERNRRAISQTLLRSATERREQGLPIRESFLEGGFPPPQPLRPLYASDLPEEPNPYQLEEEEREVIGMGFPSWIRPRVPPRERRVPDRYSPAVPPRERRTPARGRPILERRAAAPLAPIETTGSRPCPEIHIPRSATAEPASSTSLSARPSSAPATTRHPLATPTSARVVVSTTPTTTPPLTTPTSARVVTPTTRPARPAIPQDIDHWNDRLQRSLEELEQLQKSEMPKGLKESTARNTRIANLKILIKELRVRIYAVSTAPSVPQSPPPIQRPPRPISPPTSPFHPRSRNTIEALAYPTRNPYIYTTNLNMACNHRITHTPNEMSTMRRNHMRRDYLNPLRFRFLSINEFIEACKDYEYNWLSNRGKTKTQNQEEFLAWCEHFQLGNGFFNIRLRKPHSPQWTGT